jgi:hypothetical protein
MGINNAGIKPLARSRVIDSPQYSCMMSSHGVLYIASALNLEASEMVTGYIPSNLSAGRYPFRDVYRSR